MEELDELDKKILRVLQENARITHKELAVRMNLSITPVFERVKKLERKGYIQRYAAVLDPEKLNHGLIVFIHVKLQLHAHQNIMNLMEGVKNLDEVMECYHITGESDYLLKILVEDMKAYEQFVVDKLTKIPGIGNLNSSIVMSTIKSKTSITF